MHHKRVLQEKETLNSTVYNSFSIIFKHLIVRIKFFIFMYHNNSELIIFILTGEIQKQKKEIEKIQNSVEEIRIKYEVNMYIRDPCLFFNFKN